MARFNTNIGVIDKRFFQGLPSPAAAALIAGFVWVATDNAEFLKVKDVDWAACVLTIFAGLTMVSNLRYYSFKDINLRKSVPFIVVFLFAIFFVVVSSYPPGVLFLLFLAYTLSGYVLWVKERSGRKPVNKTANP